MRASGILMPVFSLPGPFGIGTLGKEAFAFVDFLADAKQTYWQILPIGPTGYGDSPYQSFSAFAGNPYFIDYRLLADVGLLTADEVPAARPVGPIDYGALYNERPVILKKAADRLLAAPSPSYEAFCEAQSFWLEDYALFMAIKAEQHQAGLADWPDALRTRQRKHWPPPGPGWRSRWIITRPCSSSSTPSGTPSRPMPMQKACSWWVTFPSMSARIPATCGPTRSSSRPMGRST